MTSSVEERAPRVGEMLDGRQVLAVTPYTGKYTQWFRWFVTVSAPTPSGRIEYAL